MKAEPHTAPRAICDSPLMKAGGCAIYQDMPGLSSSSHLLEESRLSLVRAVASAVAESDGEEHRGGAPARRFVSASGGLQLAAFYRNPELSEFLSRICNAPVQPSGESGTFTYYSRPGDHIALHRDIDICDLAVITCLLDRHHEGSSGGLTRYYPTRQHEPLSRIRATPAHGAVSVRLPTGHTMVMLGGLVPHLIEPVAAGELRIVSILCFRVFAG